MSKWSVWRLGGRKSHFLIVTPRLLRWREGEYDRPVNTTTTASLWEVEGFYKWPRSTLYCLIGFSLHYSQSKKNNFLNQSPIHSPLHRPRLKVSLRWNYSISRHLKYRVAIYRILRRKRAWLREEFPLSCTPWTIIDTISSSRWKNMLKTTQDQPQE